MSEVGHSTKVYTQHGGDTLTVESGGTLNCEASSTITLAGATTLSGAVTQSGGTTLSGTNTIGGTNSYTGANTIASGGSLVLASGAKHTYQTQTKAASYPVVATESGCLFISTAADVVYTLPSTAAGLKYTFINGSLSSGTGMSISPAAADKIMGSCDGIAITSADNKDLINTGATDVLGDSITLLGDGVDGWYIVGSTGVWAREA